LRSGLHVVNANRADFIEENQLLFRQDGFFTVRTTLGNIRFSKRKPGCSKWFLIG
jgi:hypothetical protein